MPASSGLLRRALLAAAFVISLAVTGVGIASIWVDVDVRGMITEKHFGGAGIDGGSLYFRHGHRVQPRPVTRFRKSHVLFRGRLGTLSFDHGGGRTSRWYGATIPIWIVVGSLFAPPGLALWRGPIRRYYRARRNQCLECGYDLSGTTSGRCSECGTALTATPATQGDGSARPER